MRLMIAADIHGSARWCARLLELYDALGAQRLLLLGDLLYHGPRNDLPEEYAPKRVISLLNAHRAEILCVRGNCEAEVDQMVLKFPVMADYCALMLGGRIAYATHGHLCGEDDPPPLAGGELLLCGHTHVPAYRPHEGFTYVNPGSVSIPKEGSPHSCMLWDEGALQWLDLADAHVYRSERLR